MKSSTILTLVRKNCSKTELEPLIDIARTNDAHLSVLALGAAPLLPIYSADFHP